MRQWWTQMWSRPARLDGDVQRAGLALACAYSNSHEYESELIAVRRASGVYGAARYRRKIALLGAAVAALVLVFLVI